eukprot:GHVR01061678.1.p1 GENE.GHVR01061678.1~~GHVR01061678.1.p1  ORF type:complete len:578 (-),score=119.52 GHVR01061678.1:113-1846(-)
MMKGVMRHIRVTPRVIGLGGLLGVKTLNDRPPVVWHQSVIPHNSRMFFTSPFFVNNVKCCANNITNTLPVSCDTVPNLNKTVYINEGVLSLNEYWDTAALTTQHAVKLNNFFLCLLRRFINKLSLVFRSLTVFLLLFPIILWEFIDYLFYGKSSDSSLKWWYIDSTIMMCGPCYIKLLQWIATRADLFSPSTRRRCAKFHSKAIIYPLKQTHKTLNKAYGDGWKEWLSIDPEPVGSGCIAQVYKGVYRGHSVAVKVMHPNVRERVKNDLELLMFWAKFVQKYFVRSQWLDLPSCVNEFIKPMTKQLDLGIEAEAISLFDRNFSNTHSRYNLNRQALTSEDSWWPVVETKELYKIQLPYVYNNLCTSDVLVESFVEGTTLAHWMPINSHNTHLMERVGRLCVNSFFQMLFKDNFVHADLHPGNMIIQEYTDPVVDGVSVSDGVCVCEGVCISLVDAGMTQTLHPKDRVNIIELFKLIVTRQGWKAGEMLLERSPHEECPDRPKFYKDVQTIVDNYFYSKNRLNPSEMLQSILQLSLDHKVKLDSTFVGVVLALVVLEGTVSQLHPHIDFMYYAKYYIL